jgi:hypothetical protein
VARRALLLAAALLAAAAGAACAARAARLRFDCARGLNDGLLLTVDVVRATGPQAERVQRLRERWFYDEARRQMGERVRTLTFSADDPCGCREQAVEVRAGADDRFLVVIGDFRRGNPADGRGLVVLPRNEWAGRALLVSLRGGELRVRAR